MIAGPLRLSILACFATFGAIGIVLALVGAGVPFLAAAVLACCAAGLLQYAAQRASAPRAAEPAPGPILAAAPLPCPEPGLQQQLDDYRQHTAALRHDLRGVLSPALMMSDRLINHEDPSVQRAGNAVVRSIERATALLAGSRELMASETPAAPPAGPAGPAAPAR